MQQFINNWSVELSAPATASAVQLSVPPAAAALLTGLGSGGYYLLTLVQVADGAETAWEIVRVTANAAGVLSVARGQEGTAAQAWAAGSLIEARLTQASMEDLRDAAASAVQPGDLAPVATSGAYADLAGLPTIPSTAAEVGAIPAAEKGAASGVATLDAGGKVPLAQVPAAAITNTSVVNTEAAMLALTAQVGDVAIRPDISSSFILQAEPASTLANWQQIITPAVGGGAPVGSATPQALGAASPGISSNASREDHVHPMPSAADVGADAAGTAAGALAAHTAAGDPHSQYEKASNKGAASGYAPLDASQKVPAAYLPSFVDDVIEAANFAALPATGESGKIYVTLDNNKSWRWSGSAYVEISASPGTTDAVPEGATNKYFTEGRVLATILAGLNLATGTAISAADSVLSALGKLQKQISDAVSAIAGKQDTLVSGTNLKTVNGSSLLGAGDLSISGGAVLPEVVAYAGTGRNLALADINTIIDCTSGSAVNLVIPPQSSVTWTADAEIHVRWSGTGQVSITVGSGVTIPPITAPYLLQGQGAIVTLKRRSSDVWAIIGGPSGGQLGAFRNKIFNGKMDISQRGSSLAGVSGSTYLLDRWFYAVSSAAVVTLSQQADAPAGSAFQYSNRVAVTTADASIAAGDVASIQQRIEGFNARDLVGQTFTLSFWARSSKVGTHCVSFANSGVDRTYVAEYSISAANTWEFKTVTVTGGLPTSGTWDFTTGIGLRVDFALAAGSTFQTTPGAWQTGNFIGTANQVNVLDTVGNIFAITGVQLEVGPVATSFEHRAYGSELALCQRYYQTGAVEFSGYVVSGGSYLVRDPFKVQMRGSPTVTLTSTYALGFPNTSGSAASGPGGFSETRVSDSNQNAGGFGSQFTASAEL